MKFPKLTSLVPATEHFDESAIGGDGLWLSTGHVDALEASLAASEVENIASQETITKQAGEVETLTADLATATANEQKLNDSIVEKDAKILELETQVAKLGKTPSGTGTPLPANKDANPDTAPVAAYLSDEAEENKWFDAQMKNRVKLDPIPSAT